VGVGAFGRNHARVYHELAKEGVVRFAGVYDADAGRATAVAKEFGTEVFPSLESLAGKVDAASVAVPTVRHLAVARALMEAGIDVLIEKPLAAALAEADEIARVAENNGRIVQVGHLERFNPAVQATLPLVKQPLFFEVHRLSIFTARALDVDVILDLMIHDLDVVLSLVQAPVSEVRAVGIPVISDKVDIANVRLEFENGCVANFTASRVSTERVRKLRFFQPHQYISVDYSRQDVMVFTVGEEGGLPLPGLPPGAKVSMVKPPVTGGEPLRAELRSFVEAVASRQAPLVGLTDGRRALALALEILAAISRHGERINLAGGVRQ